jgi:hypothetical protein
MQCLYGHAAAVPEIFSEIDCRRSPAPQKALEPVSAAEGCLETGKWIGHLDARRRR